MTTIVEHRDTNGRYVVVGTGFGQTFREKTDFLGFKNTTWDKVGVVCVSDADGTLKWFDGSELRLVSVDGQSPERILRPQDAVEER